MGNKTVGPVYKTPVDYGTILQKITALWEELYHKAVVVCKGCCKIRDKTASLLCFAKL